MPPLGRTTAGPGCGRCSTGSRSSARAGAADVVRRRHRRDGAGHAAGAVPRGRRRRGSTEGAVGWLFAAIAIGAVLGGLSSGWIGRVAGRGSRWSVAVVVLGRSPSPCPGWSQPLWLAVALLAVAGAADLVCAVYRQTILQTYAPDEMRGRMQGVFIVVVAGGPRLGDVRAGAMAAATSATVSWVGGGVACVVVVLVAAIAVRPFWNYRDDPASLQSISSSLGCRS